MKLLITSFLFILLSIQVEALEVESVLVSDTVVLENEIIILEVDQDGIKNGFFRRFIKHFIDEMEYTFHLTEEGNYKDGSRQGEWKFYQYLLEDQITELRDDYSIYDVSSIRQTISFIDGNKEGKTKYETGDLYGGPNTNFIGTGFSGEDELESIKEVEKIDFDVYGMLCEGTYNNNQRDGVWLVYDLNKYGRKGRPEIYAKLNYSNGQKLEPWETFMNSAVLLPGPQFMDDVLIREIHYDESYSEGYLNAGLKAGTWKEYSGEGVFIRESIYDSNGILMLDEDNSIQIVHPHPELKEINNYIFTSDKKYAFLFSEEPDNSWIYLKYKTNSFSLIDSDKIQLDFDGYGRVVDVSRDGRFLALDANDKIVYYDLESKKISSDNPGEDMFSSFYYLESSYQWVNGRFKIENATWEKSINITDTTTNKTAKILDSELGLKTHFIEYAQVSEDGKFLMLLFSNPFKNQAFIWSIDEGRMIWNSGKLKEANSYSDYVLLLENNIIITPSVTGEETGTNLYWYDFVNDKVVYSTNSEKWKYIEVLYQFREIVCVGIRGDGYKLDTISQINLSSGMYSYPPYLEKDKDIISNVVSDFEDSVANASPSLYAMTKSNALKGHWVSLYDLHFNEKKIKKLGKAENQIDRLYFDDFDIDSYFLGEDVNIYKDYYIHYALNNKVTFQEFQKQYYMLFYSSELPSRELLFWNGKHSKNDERLVRVMFSKENKPFFYSDDNYYFSSENLTGKLNFRFRNKSYSFTQFDLKYNRPDIILDRLGYADSTLISAYYKAYQKRLDRMGFTEEMLAEEFHVPQLVIENVTKIPRLTSEDKITVGLYAEDSLYNLDRINIWVNQVPILGIEGISLREKMVKEYQTNTTIPLSAGLNKIEVSVLNQAGAESFRESVTVENISNSSESELYVVAISVSEYQDESMNLRYAVKDGRDIAKTFNKMSGRAWSKVHVDTLFDKEATRAKVSAIKDKLMSTNVNDQVVLFISGHGLLDEDYDFYFAGHDMNFSDPSKNGISYEMLERLLDGIPARKKLFMMDACHSGEVDKEEIVEVSARGNEETEGLKSGINRYSYRGAQGTSEESVANLNLNNSFELMKDLFVDLNRGSGAVVISAASGDSYALESDEWNNGVFSYAVINGLVNKAADSNGDGKVMVSELREYVVDEVQELTGGLQKPTIRQENIEYDFRIWE